MSKIDEMASIKEQIKTLETQYNVLRDEVVSEYGVGKKAEGQWLLDVADSYRFDAKLAKKVLSESELTKVSVLEPKAKLVETFLPEKIDQCRKHIGHRVTIARNPDVPQTANIEI